MELFSVWKGAQVMTRLVVFFSFALWNFCFKAQTVKADVLFGHEG